MTLSEVKRRYSWESAAKCVRLGKRPTKLTLDAANYIQHHISEPITVEKMAEELFLSRSCLSRRFKEEAGESLRDFILKEKTEEAKRLLRYSDKSLTAVSNCLGFSSPSHFSRTFKKDTGYFPGSTGGSIREARPGPFCLRAEKAHRLKTCGLFILCLVCFAQATRRSAALRAVLAPMPARTLSLNTSCTSAQSSVLGQVGKV